MSPECSVTQNFKELKIDISLPMQTFQMYQHPRNLQEKSSTVLAETLSSNLEECFLCENQASCVERH